MEQIIENIKKILKNVLNKYNFAKKYITQIDELKHYKYIYLFDTIEIIVHESVVIGNTSRGKSIHHIIAIDEIDIRLEICFTLLLGENELFLEMMFDDYNKILQNNKNLEQENKILLAKISRLENEIELIPSSEFILNNIQADFKKLCDVIHC